MYYLISLAIGTIWFLAHMTYLIYIAHQEYQYLKFRGKTNLSFSAWFQTTKYWPNRWLWRLYMVIIFFILLHIHRHYSLMFHIWPYRLGDFGNPNPFPPGFPWNK